MIVCKKSGTVIPVGNMLTTSVIGSLAGTAAMMFINGRYYSRRRELFIY